MTQASAPPYDARQVANLILDICDARGEDVSVLKLLKLLYYSYGWHLVSTGNPLFHSPIEAWKHGPVVRSVWLEFRGQKGAVRSRAMCLDLSTGQREQARAPFSVSEYSLVEQVVRSFSGYSAWGLSELTHETGSPWSKVWHSEDTSANLGFRITDRAIREHFLEALGRAIPS